MKGFLAPMLLTSLFLFPSYGDDSEFGFDRREEDPFGSLDNGSDAEVDKEIDAEMDKVLRPHVFARYDKVSHLTEVGEDLYRAQYRLPRSVYAPNWEGELPEVQEWLENEGVEFGSGSSVSFDERLRILEVVQTLDQLTRVELFLARFGGEFVARIGLEVIELPLVEGWSLINDVAGLVDHTEIRDEALDLGGRVVESFSSLLDLGGRSKFQRFDGETTEVNASEDDSLAASASFEFEPCYTERFNELLINFAYERSAGEWEARRVVTFVRVPNRGGIIASSWRSREKLQFLFLSGEVSKWDAVERVRRLPAE